MGGCGCGCRRRPRALKRHHGDHFSKRGPDLVASQQSLGRFAPDCQPGSTRFPLNPEAGIQGPPTKQTKVKGPWDSVVYGVQIPLAFDVIKSHAWLVLDAALCRPYPHVQGRPLKAIVAGVSMYLWGLNP